MSVKCRLALSINIQPNPPIPGQQCSFSFIATVLSTCEDPMHRFKCFIHTDGEDWGDPTMWLDPPLMIQDSIIIPDEGGRVKFTFIFECEHCGASIKKDMWFNL